MGLKAKTVEAIIRDAKKREAASGSANEWDWWLLTSAYQAGVDAAHKEVKG